MVRLPSPGWVVRGFDQRMLRTSFSAWRRNASTEASAGALSNIPERDVEERSQLRED
jgi:hypothetical protein